MNTTEENQAINELNLGSKEKKIENLPDTRLLLLLENEEKVPTSESTNFQPRWEMTIFNNFLTCNTNGFQSLFFSASASRLLYEINFIILKQFCVRINLKLYRNMWINFVRFHREQQPSLWNQVVFGTSSRSKVMILIRVQKEMYPHGLALLELFHSLFYFKAFFWQPRKNNVPCVLERM